jgi:hypothetical protein
MTTHDELEKKFGSSDGYFEVLPWHLPGWTTETMKSITQDSQCSIQDSNQAPMVHKLQLEPTCSAASGNSMYKLGMTVKWWAT